jgi:hypothetical protein
MGFIKNLYSPRPNNGNEKINDEVMMYSILSSNHHSKTPIVERNLSNLNKTEVEKSK